MTHWSRILATMLVSIASQLAMAQADSAFIRQRDKMRQTFERRANADRQLFDNQRRQQQARYDSIRDAYNRQYVEQLRRQWKKYNAIVAPPAPHIEEVKPIVYHAENHPQTAGLWRWIKDFIVTILPERKPQPQPIVPIVAAEDNDSAALGPDVANTPISVPALESKPDSFKFEFLGRQHNVCINDSHRFELATVTHNSLADAWQLLTDHKYDCVVTDCLKLRQECNMPDWPYLNMIQSMCNTFFGKGSNEAVLLAAYIYQQSGYSMRLAFDDADHLHMLVGSDHLLFERPYFIIDGQKFWPLDDNDVKHFRLSHASYPGEKDMSLYMDNLAATDGNHQMRILKSKRYPDATALVDTDLRLTELYNKYPCSMLNDDPTTMWLFYASAPLSPSVKRSLYPALTKAIADLDTLQAVNVLLNFVQTSLEYEYDNVVWGVDDRVFFAEESLHYPYCDCEDRSILFTRLVRDLLHLPCALVYYPGHLAAAVCMGKDVEGDHLNVKGKCYTIADPTYINAPLGYTMPQMDNRTATVIPLE